MIQGKRDGATVTAEGKRISKLIDGVIVRHATTHADERGELCEIYDPAWGITPEAMVYCYLTVVRAGKVKGWVYHEDQIDRLFVATGALKVVLFDRRKDSPTHGMVNEFTLGERNRGLVVIPKQVLHAVHNVGTTEATFVNLPSRPYNHAKPDKFRVAFDSPEIPYTFDNRLGW
ncbi:MAG: dTDP-4-dehydrorhamnose 3,5-epimerase family protein [Planctomycetes bacterium]|nr:dTDP-4-dehydrorhamnose 3,5-epimerase family protein [Planctomycetota bacterium]